MEIQRAVQFALRDARAPTLSKMLLASSRTAGWQATGSRLANPAARAIFRRSLTTTQTLRAPKPTTPTPAPRHNTHPSQPSHAPSHSPPLSLFTRTGTGSPQTSRAKAPAAPSGSARENPAAEDDPLDLARFINDKRRDFEDRWSPFKQAGPELRLRPSTGRTVHVSGNVDTARSFQLLNVLCRANRVAQDLQRQRFHERPGLKRKRLRRERWRKRFKAGFKAMVNRVTELKKQGW